MPGSRKKPAHKKAAGRKEKERAQSDEGYSGPVNKFIGGEVVIGEAPPGTNPVHQVGSFDSRIHQFGEGLVITPSAPPKGRPLAAWKEPYRAEFERYYDAHGEQPSHREMLLLLNSLADKDEDFDTCIINVDMDNECITYNTKNGERTIKDKTIKNFLTELLDEVSG